MGNWQWQASGCWDWRKPGNWQWQPSSNSSVCLREASWAWVTGKRGFTEEGRLLMAGCALGQVLRWLGFGLGEVLIWQIQMGREGGGHLQGEGQPAGLGGLGVLVPQVAADNWLTATVAELLGSKGRGLAAGGVAEGGTRMGRPCRDRPR